MPDQLLHWVLAAVILVHGIAHVGAIGALWWVGSGRATDAGGWTTARTWLAPSLGSDVATRIAVATWVASMLGFVLTSIAFLGIGLPVELWRPLGIGSALVSGAGILAFLGTWPAFNTLAALAVNAAVLVAALANWPPASVLGA